MAFGHWTVLLTLLVVFAAFPATGAPSAHGRHGHGDALHYHPAAIAVADSLVL